MKILVFGGSGKIGTAVAWDLVKEDDVETVGIVGRREAALEDTKAWIGSPKIKIHPLDIDDRGATIALMQQYDVCVSTLPDRNTSYKFVHAGVEAGVHIVDMLEEYHRRPDLYELEGLELPEGLDLYGYGDWFHEKAIENNITFLDGIGFAPGLSNITTGEGIRKMDKAEAVIARVGGIPEKGAAARHPLRYMITWAFDHVLREYMVKLFVIKNGEQVEVDATTDREKFKFSQFGEDEMLECAVTPGMPSFIYTRPELQEFAEKTVRWPTHWDSIDTLKECGMLDLEPVEIQGVKIAPRDYLLSVIGPKLKQQEGDTDVCVMWCNVDGIKDGKKTRINYYLWDEADTVNGISSMARVTGFSAAIGALFIGRGLITAKGVVPPEDCFAGDVYEAYIEELKKRNVIVLETMETLD